MENGFLSFDVQRCVPQQSIWCLGGQVSTTELENPCHEGKRFSKTNKQECSFGISSMTKSSYISKGEPCSERHDVTRSRRRQFVMSNLIATQSSAILDVGTGLGIYSREISASVNFLLGIDIDEDSLRKAREVESHSCYAVMNGEKLALRDGSFDCVMMIEVIEHIPDDRSAIAESHRVLKEDGVLIITAPNRLFPFETHGIKIGSRILGSKGFGFPFLPWLPVTARKHLANARVYTLKSFGRLLEGLFEIETLEFMKPNLDQMNYYFPRLRSVTDILNGPLTRVEKSCVLRNFMPTIAVCARKK